MYAASSCTNVSLVVSVQSLVLIAVDRFGAVVFPLRSPLISSKVCPFFIVATRIVAMATWSPNLSVFKLVEYPGGQACAPPWNEVFGQSFSFTNFMLALNVVFFYTPLVLIAALYIIIYFKLKAQTIPGEQSVNARQQCVRRDQNVLKMAIAIVLGFVVCWLPYNIYCILIFFVSDILSCSFQYYCFVAVIMSFTNCSINPCICFIFSKHYPQYLRNLLRCF